jgi:hypothetical protein
MQDALQRSEQPDSLAASTINVHKPRRPADVAAESARGVRLKRIVNNSEAVVVQLHRHVSSSAGMPARPLAAAARRTHTVASESPTLWAAASDAGLALGEGRTLGDSVATTPTQASICKTQPAKPNTSDHVTGWGPIENLTLAALDFKSQRAHVPREHESFTELALWLARNALAQEPPSEADPPACSPLQAETAHRVAGEDLTPADMQHFEHAAKELLGLNRNALAALIAARHESDPDAHAARRLWRSIAQPANMPAVR